jgi:hypothetical protein
MLACESDEVVVIDIPRDRLDVGRVRDDLGDAA